MNPLARGAPTRTSARGSLVLLRGRRCLRGLLRRGRGLRGGLLRDVLFLVGVRGGDQPGPARASLLIGVRLLLGSEGAQAKFDERADRRESGLGGALCREEPGGCCSWTDAPGRRQLAAPFETRSLQEKPQVGARRMCVHDKGGGSKATARWGRRAPPPTGIVSSPSRARWSRHCG